MALTEKAKCFVEEKAEQRKLQKKERTKLYISQILKRTGLSQIELSLAMGVSAPLIGQQGRTAMVHRWIKGYDSPSPQNLAILELLAKGVLRLILVGRERNRRLCHIAATDSDNLSNEVAEFRRELLEIQNEFRRDVHRIQNKYFGCRRLSDSAGMINEFDVTEIRKQMHRREQAQVAIRRCLLELELDQVDLVEDNAIDSDV